LNHKGKYAGIRHGMNKGRKDKGVARETPEVASQSKIDRIGDERGDTSLET
jgi:hypothetical protein